jgi:hypothetical protein
MVCWPGVGFVSSADWSSDGAQPRTGAVPKTYPRFGNAAFLAIIATLRINKLPGIDNAQ